METPRPATTNRRTLGRYFLATKHMSVDRLSACLHARACPAFTSDIRGFFTSKGTAEAFREALGCSSVLMPSEILWC